MPDPPLELATFCRDEWPRLVGALTLVTGSRDVGMDLAQETLVRVCRDWRKVSTFDAPGAWAHRVAMNLANSHYRRRSAERRAFTKMTRRGDPVHESAAGPTSDATDSIALRTAVSELPLRQRMAVALRYYLDLSVTDTAQAMDCPVGTVKTLTRQAILSLRDAGLVDDHDASDEYGDEEEDAHAR